MAAECAVPPALRRQRLVLTACLASHFLPSGWKSAFPADHYSRYQFHLRGVQQILDGLESASFNPTLLQARSRSPHTAGGRSASSSRERAPMSIADRRKQHSRTRADLRGPSPSASDRTAAGAGRADPADYKSACRKWIEGRAGEGATVSVSVAGGTKLAEERVCALAVLDWALSNAELEARIQRWVPVGLSLLPQIWR